MIAKSCEHMSIAEDHEHSRFVYVDARAVGTAAAEPAQNPTSAKAKIFAVENMEIVVRGCGWASLRKVELWLRRTLGPLCDRPLEHHRNRYRI
jgi:hypothetical protein